MARYAIFLRGMNLGNRRIKNPELVKCFETLGFDNVEAFLASGNVALDTRRAAKSLGPIVETGLRAALGYDVPSFVRSAKALERIARASPFKANEASSSRGKVQVAFLTRPPSAEAKRLVDVCASNDDWLSLGDEELFWWPKGGLSESQLDLKTLEKALGPFTIRTQRTLIRMVEKCFR